MTAVPIILAFKYIDSPWSEANLVLLEYLQMTKLAIMVKLSVIISLLVDTGLLYLIYKQIIS